MGSGSWCAGARFLGIGQSLGKSGCWPDGRRSRLARFGPPYTSTPGVRSICHQLVGWARANQRQPPVPTHSAAKPASPKSRADQRRHTRMDSPSDFAAHLRNGQRILVGRRSVSWDWTVTWQVRLLARWQAFSPRPLWPTLHLDTGVRSICHQLVGWARADQRQPPVPTHSAAKPASPKSRATSAGPPGWTRHLIRCASFEMGSGSWWAGARFLGIGQSPSKSGCWPDGRRSRPARFGHPTPRHRRKVHLPSARRVGQSGPAAAASPNPQRGQAGEPEIACGPAAAHQMDSPSDSLRVVRNGQRILVGRRSVSWDWTVT